MKTILSKKTYWSDMSNKEHIVIENCILLVGMLFKLCKIELIGREKRIEVINTEAVKTIGAEVDAALKHTKRWRLFA